MDGHDQEILSELRRIKRERASLDQARQLLLDEQSELLRRRADQTLAPQLIRGRLQNLDKKRTQLDHAEAEFRGRERTLIAQLGSKPSSSSRSPGSATRVRQSVLYSAKKGPRGRQGRPVKEHTGDASSNEPGRTNTNLSQFEALTLNTAPLTLESADRAVVHAGDMDSHVPDSTSAKQPAVREGLSPRSQERWQRIDQYLAEHTFDDMWEGMVAIKNGFCNPPKKVPFPTKKSSKKLPLADSLQSPHGLDAQSFQTTTQCEESTEQIIENGKQWMKKEVMEAFNKYIKETDNFIGIEFELDELLHQCLSVETYEKIFHHYNFTVKMKRADSDKWSSTLYFAQVKEMYGRKYYFCYPLDPFEDGICHACKNQGMDAMRHPAVPIGYETGQADTGCPFFDDGSDDDGIDDDAMARAFSKAFLGGAPY